MVQVAMVGLGPEAEEVRLAMQELVGRFGVAGQISVQGQWLCLEGSGPSVSVPLGGLLEQWTQLSAEQRQRRTQALARELAQARRSAVAASGTTGTGLQLGLLKVPLTILGVALAGIAAVLFWRGPGSSGAVPGVDAGPSETQRYEAARDARLRAACEKSRLRFQQGATPTVMDVDGWAVELLLLREGGGPRLLTDPGLGPFLQLDSSGREGRFVWPGAPELLEISGPGTVVQLADASLLDPGGAEGLTLTFTGRYVAPYFAESQRPLYTRIAATLAERLGATHAALYARCQHERSHQLGSWFRSTSPSNAAAILVYAMGAWADPPQIELADAGAGQPFERRAARVEVLNRVESNAQRLTREKLSHLIGEAGGMIAGAPRGGPTTLTFPFKDGNRAARASRRIAFELQLTNLR